MTGPAAGAAAVTAVSGSVKFLEVRQGLLFPTGQRRWWPAAGYDSPGRHRGGNRRRPRPALSGQGGKQRDCRCSRDVRQPGHRRNEGEEQAAADLARPNEPDVYAYPTKRFDFHGRRLDLNRPADPGR